MLAIREHNQTPPSFDTLFSQIPAILLTQTKGIYLVHLIDIIHIYNQTPLDNLDGLKQELVRLRGSTWRFFYLDLENLIKSSYLLLDCQHESNQLAAFYKTFTFELNKVRDFCSVKGGEIDRRLAFMKNTPCGKKGMAHFMDIHDTVDELTYDIHDLWHFIKVNYRAFLGIVNFLDGALGNPGGRKSIPQHQTQAHLLLQRLYRLLTPDQFLDWNLFLHWCLDLGKLYQDQLQDARAINNYNSGYDDHDGSPLFPPPSPPHTLYAPRMTRDSSNASTGSLLSSTAPPSPTSTTSSHDIPSVTGPSDQHIYSDDPLNIYDHFTPSPSSSRSLSRTDWLDNIDFDSPTPDVKHAAFGTQDSVFKFWVHPNNLLEVTMYLAKYMKAMNPQHISSSYPMATFEIDSPEHQGRYHHEDTNHPKHATTDSSSHHHQHWQPITTLYLDTDRVNGNNADNSNLVNHKTIQSTLRLRQYNNINDNKDNKYNNVISKGNNTSLPTAHFYALEKKIYSPMSPSTASSRVTGSRTSTDSSDGSSKKLGKRPYRHQQQPLRRQPSSSSTTSTISTLSSAPSVINSDQDKEHYHCLHRRSSMDPITKSSHSAIQSRIWLKSKRCKPWLNHQWSLKSILVKSSPSHHYKMNGKQDPNRKLIEQHILDMESDLQEQLLTPVLKTSFNRIGFKWTADHINIGEDQQQQRDMVITVDTDITMVRSDDNDDDQLVGKDPLQQQDYLCTTQSSNDLSRFPYAVLQIKLPHDFATMGDVKTSSFLASLPWLNQLLSCPML